MNLSIASAIILIFTVLTVQAAVDEIFECVEGIGYQENKCNNCFCNRGLLACTEMACISDDQYELEHCEVGTVWEEGCEKCWCAEDIGTVCTTNCGRKHETHN